MLKLFQSAPAPKVVDEARYRELRETMQNIVIAHAAICYKQLRPEQLAEVQAEWTAAIKGRGWAPFFAVDGILPGAPRAWDTACNAAPSQHAPIQLR